VTRLRGGVIDWSEIRQRLARAEAATREALRPSPERACRILEERAQLAARPSAAAGPAQGEEVEVVRFSLGRERYAMETHYVREVLGVAELSQVPGTPGFFAGLANLRGNLLAVVDLARFLEVPRIADAAFARIIVCGRDDPELGFLADGVDEVTAVPVREVLSPTGHFAANGRDYLRGMTGEALIILDGAALLNDRRLFIDQGDATASPIATRGSAWH